MVMVYHIVNGIHKLHRFLDEICIFLYERLKYVRAMRFLSEVESVRCEII